MQWRQTRHRDGRSWRIGQDADVAWINQGTSEPPGNGITIAIPAIYEAYWTVDVPGSAGRDHRRDDALELDSAVIDLLAASTAPQPWWIGFMERGGLPPSHLVFPGAMRVQIVDGTHVLIEAGPEQALAWRDEDERSHGPLPDVMFPHDRSWLSNTLWDDHWMCLGGTVELQQSFVEHPLLGDYAHPVSASDPDATPPGHDVWWHR